MANTINVSVLADVRDINRKLGNVEKQLGGFGKKMSNLGTGIAGAFAAVGVGQLFTDIVSGASDLNETMSKTEQIFGQSASGLFSWANGAAKSMGLSKQAALDGVSTFGNFFNQLGFGAAETEKMSKQFVQAAVDLGSFHNAAPVDVMNALSAATRGEYDSLQKYIPTINAAAVEQEALAMTGKKSAKELTAQEKAMATNKIVMEGMGKAQGDYARTSDGLANKQKSLSATFQNLKDRIGTALLPVVTQLGTFMMDTVVPAFEDFLGWVKENSTWLAPLGVALGAIAVSLGVVMGAMRAYAVVQGIVNAVMAANPIGLLVLAIVGLIAAFVYLWNTNEGFRQAVIKVWDAIKGFVLGVVNWFKTEVPKAWNTLKEKTTAAWNAVKKGVTDAFNAVKKFISDSLNTIKTNWTNAWNSVKDFVGRIWDGIKNGVKTGIDNLVSNVKGIKDKVVGALSGAASWLVNAGKNIVNGLIDGVKRMGGTLKSAILNIIPGPVRSVVESALGINSPSRVFRDYGKNIVQGLVIGLDGMGGKVVKAASGLAGAVSDGFEAPRLSLNAVGASGTTGNTYHLTVQALDPQSASRAVIEAIREHERMNGSGWRA